MRRATLKRSLMMGAGVVGLALAGPVAAQVQSPQGLPPPVYKSVDAHGVDLASGRYNLALPGVSIGSPGNGLAQTRQGLELYDSLRGVIERKFLTTGSHAPLIYTITVGDSSAKFIETNNDGNFLPYGGQGAQTLARSGTIYTYTDGEGAEYKFEYFSGVPSTDLWYLTQVKRPDGEILTYTYVPNTIALRSIVSTLGYMIHYTYTGSGLSLQTDRVTALNLAIDYCAPDAVTCTYTKPWPWAAFSNGGFTNALNYTTAVTPSDGATGSFTTPRGVKTLVTFGSSSANLGVNIGRVTSVAVSNGSTPLATWTYDYSLTAQQALAGIIIKANDSLRGQQQVIASQELGAVSQHKNFKGETTNFTLNEGGNFRGRIDALSPPQGGSMAYDYDLRGNLKTITRTRASGSLDPIIVSAAFDTTCSSAKTCNRPTSTTDARGYTTNYEYYAHGGLKTIKLPAVTSPNGTTVRPTATYYYEEKSARYKGPGNTWVDGPGIYRLTKISTCTLSETCAGTAEEAVTTFDYGPDNQPRNLLPVSTTVANGTGSIVATTTMTYDDAGIGNLVAVNGPLSGSADTTYYFYDALRQRTGMVEPDADGASPFVYRATKTEYNADGLVTSVKRGTVTNPTDPAMSTLSVLASVDSLYDDFDRVIKETVTRDGAVQSITQYAYDAGGRLICTATRMDLSAVQADSACVQTNTAAPKDRIIAIQYDGLDRPWELREGVGTDKERATKTITYNVAGSEETIKDSKLNTTTYEYDGFDRLEKVRYPNTTGGGSSTIDYDFYTYDPAGNRKTWQHRFASPETAAAQTVTYDYDGLNRVTSKTLPATSYVYDNLGHVTSSSQGGIATSAAYDALGRKTSETIGALGAVESEYDPAGRRRKLKWPDGNYVNYDYDNLGQMTAIRANDATSGAGVLAGYTYDDLGRRKGMTRGNGVSTNYAYGVTPRTWSLAHDLPGSAKDLTLTFAYNASNQITTRTSSNDLYDWKTSLGFNRAYGANGLNQLTIGQSLSYSPRGNMATDGAYSYQYDIDNRLVSAQSGAVTTNLTYDGLNRLYRFDQPSATRLLYDGASIIGEYADGATSSLRRYVPGPSQDESVVWYEGTNLASPSWLIADNQGSIIARTDVNGQTLAAYTYDEYGYPSTTNGAGLFQYTGQVWLSQLGLYHYKARVYSPSYGRFLQTDPMGYATGMNAYGYVRNDPLNLTDPSGLVPKCSAVPDPPPTSEPTAPPPVPKFECKDDGTSPNEVDKVVIQARQTRRLTDGTRLIFAGSEQEQGIRVNAGGVFSYPLKDQKNQVCDDGSKRVVNVFNVKGLDGDSGGHTHPDGLKGDIVGLPGPEDGLLAGATGRAAYVISSRGAFRVEGGAGGYSISQIAGRGMSSSEKRDMLAQIAKWNQNNGGSGQKCHIE